MEDGLVGAAGAVLVALAELYQVLREQRWHLPDELRRPGWWVGQAIRVVIGAGVAAALAAGDQISGPMGAVAAGAAAPAIIERLASAAARMPLPSSAATPVSVDVRQRLGEGEP